VQQRGLAVVGPGEAVERAHADPRDEGPVEGLPVHPEPASERQALDPLAHEVDPLTVHEDVEHLLDVGPGDDRELRGGARPGPDEAGVARVARAQLAHRDRPAEARVGAEGAAPELAKRALGDLRQELVAVFEEAAHVGRR